MTDLEKKIIARCKTTIRLVKEWRKKIRRENKKLYAGLKWPKGAKVGEYKPMRINTIPAYVPPEKAQIT